MKRKVSTIVSFGSLLSPLLLPHTRGMIEFDSVPFRGVSVFIAMAKIETNIFINCEVPSKWVPEN